MVVIQLIHLQTSQTNKITYGKNGKVGKNGTVKIAQVSGKNGKVGKNGTFSILGFGVRLVVKNGGLGLGMGV